MTSASSSGAVRAEGLHPQLVVLPVAARLRALVAEHGAVVVELHRLGQRVHAVLHVGPATGAVPSGRRVMLRPPRSSNVYISLRTMSVDSPTPAVNSRVSSNVGVSMRAVAVAREDLLGPWR